MISQISRQPEFFSVKRRAVSGVEIHDLLLRPPSGDVSVDSRPFAKSETRCACRPGIHAGKRSSSAPSGQTQRRGAGDHFHVEVPVVLLFAIPTEDDLAAARAKTMGSSLPAKVVSGITRGACGGIRVLGSLQLQAGRHDNDDQCGDSGGEDRFGGWLPWRDARESAEWRIGFLKALLLKLPSSKTFTSAICWKRFAGSLRKQRAMMRPTPLAPEARWEQLRWGH